MPIRLVSRFRPLAAVLLASTFAGNDAGAELFEVGNRLLESTEQLQSSVFSGRALAAGDLDGDGRPELVVGDPGWDDPAAGAGGVDAGGISVFAVGADRSATRLFSLSGAPGPAAAGHAVALGDFDGDGDLEIAVGEPEARISGHARAGRVRVWERQADGEWTSTPFHQDSPGMPDVAGEGDLFGFALAVGDFDGDGRDDLAVGAPGESSDADSAGIAVVLTGSSAGLTSADSRRLALGEESYPGLPAAGDVLGLSLTAGDFDGDGRDDLAIGIPGFDLTSPAPVLDCGKVLVIEGGSGGLQSVASVFLDEDDLGSGTAEPLDHLGDRLAAGDFDGDGVDDLVVGIPGEAFAGDTGNAGRVSVIPGAAGLGLRPSQDRNVSAATFGATPERGAQLGHSFAAGDHDGDGRDDLVIGEPFRDVEVGGAGQSWLVHGSSGDLLDVSRVQRLSAVAGLAASPAAFADFWGVALAVADFDGDGTGDLAVGLPGRAMPDGATVREDAGAVQLLFGALFADGFERGSVGGWSSPTI